MAQVFEIESEHSCHIDPFDVCDECLAIEFEEIWEFNSRQCNSVEMEGAG